MELEDRATTSAGEGAALRDADDVLARAVADEAAAGAARERYRTRPMAAVDPDERIGPLLLPGEHVVAVRRSALLERRQPEPGTRAATGLAGALYVTSHRLVLVGRTSLSFGLGSIQDVMLSGDRLLLVLRDGQGLALDVQQPRLLRVELAAVRAAVQSGSQWAAPDQPLVR
jgi:hypothetical protein